MIFRARTARLCYFVVIIAAFLAPAFAGEDLPSSKLAQQALIKADIHGGLIVYVGCADASLCAALHGGPSYLVQGLTTDTQRLKQARAQIQKQGIYGPVSVDQFDGQHLPYADNVVNLVVADDLGGVSREEALRVLVPEGKLCVKDEKEQWQISVKPRPRDIDVWTHFFHDASGNAVAHDEKVAPPGALQWSEGPEFTRSHEHIPSMYALVSTGARIFYVADEAPIASIRNVPNWQLIARDAFNGILLWKKPITTWYPHLVHWGNTPPHLEYRLVSVGNRVYVTMGWHEPLSALDAATGETVRVYEKTEGTEKVLYHQGVLLLVVRGVTDSRRAEGVKWAKLIRNQDKVLDKRNTAKSLIQKLRDTDTQGSVNLVAIGAESGRQLWTKEWKNSSKDPEKPFEDLSDAQKLSFNTLCAGGDQVYYQAGSEVVCLDLKTGREKWSQAQTLRLVQGENVVCATDESAAVLSAQTGKLLWQTSLPLAYVYDVFVAGGSLWIGGFKPYVSENPRQGPHYGPYFVMQLDLKTGKLLKSINPQNPGHHHRCYVNKATDRYILSGRRGTEFIDLASGEVLWNNWARGICKYGIMPCNGLLYAPPHACACYMEAKLTGFNVMAPRRSITTADPIVEQGPAYEQKSAGSASITDWPMYRHDVERSGFTTTQVPAKLHVHWRADVGSRLTAPTIADGRVFTVSVDQHQIRALDAETGNPAWQYTAGARVDSSPTIYQGRSLFGCRDGWLYSLQAADGKLAWRTRLAAEDRRVVTGGQLESVSPLPGSVIIVDGVAYATAGRNSYLDSGIHLCRLDPQSGKTLSRSLIYTPDPQPDKQSLQDPYLMPGQREDLLSADADHVYLRNMVFGRDGQPRDKGNPHLFAMTAFLDDAWAHRSYWIFGTHCSYSCGGKQREKDLIYGRLITFNPTTIYGYGRDKVDWSNQILDGHYRLFALNRVSGKTLWEKPLPIQVRAMVATKAILFVAGPPNGSSVGPGDLGEGKPALLLAVSMADGSVLAQTEMPGIPIFDGLAAANGRLYAAMENGSIVCLK